MSDLQESSVFDMNPEQHLIVAEAMAAELKPYLLSDTLYWSLKPLHHASFTLPLGTLGGMLTRLHELNHIRDELSPSQQDRLDSAQHQADVELDHWLVQAEEKALREATMRLRNWQLYAGELDGDARRYADEYGMQAQGRIALRHVLEIAGKALEGTSVTTQVMMADKLMKSLLEAAPFLLDDRLEGAYPANKWWWLYAAPEVD